MRSYIHPKKLPTTRFKLRFVLLSLALHSLVFYWLTQKHSKPEINEARRASPLKVKYKEKKNQQIVEAKLFETQKKPDPKEAFLGQQDRQTDTPSRLPPSNSSGGRQATRFASGRKPPSSDKAKIAYQEILPDQTSFEDYHNDFIADESIPIGEVLDVNTTEYRFIGYFSSVRKQVDLAFYDPRSSLREHEKVRETLSKKGSAQFEGKSVAEIRVERSGFVSSIVIVESSGDEQIDAAWTNILNLAAPFSPLPLDYPQEQLIFRYTLYYNFVIRDNRPIPRFQF